MSGLQLYKQQNLDISNFTPREVEIYDALQSQMIKDVPEADLYELFRYAVNKAYLMAVYTAPEPEQFIIVVDETMKMAKSKYGFVRSKEVPLIFVRGCSKEFGEFMGLNFITFMGWFDGYIKDKKRIELTTPVKETKEPTLQERFEIASKNAMDAFLAYKTGKDISLQAPTVYRFLRGIKLFEYSIEEQQEFYDQAERDIHQELRLKKTVTIEKFKREEIEKQLNGELSIEEKITAQQRRLGLYAFFQELILNEKDLQQLINSKWKQ